MALANARMNCSRRKLQLLCTSIFQAVVVLVAVLGFSVRPVYGQTAGEQETQESCRKFVQAFYDWYLSKEGRSGKMSTPSMDIVLKRKAEVLSPELYRLLKEDREAQKKATGDIVGIDFDPFLYSQDPSVHFEAVNVTRKGPSYFVGVYGVQSGKRQEHVIPELVQQDGHWIFVNFHYGKNQWSDDSNLLQILKDNKADREKKL